MANISFEKEMRLNKKESDALLDILLSDDKGSYKITTPPAKRLSGKELKEFLNRKK